MPQPEADSQLLRDYLTGSSQAAFAELVRRHLNPVYAVALRQVGGDAHLAADVTQVVFATLARKATKLQGRQALGGWLHRTTHFVARDVVRAEVRRRRREQEAIAIEEQSPGAAAEVDWERLRIVLDELMEDLEDSDRDAIWMRFYQGLSFGDIAGTFALQENTVRMRVTRALERLRSALGKRGVASTVAALETALVSQAIVVPPATLGPAVTNAALAAGNTGIGTGAISIFIMSKLKVGILTALVAVGVTVAVVQVKTNLGLRARVGTMQSERVQVAQLRASNRQITASIANLQGNPKSAKLAKLRERAAVLAARPPWVDEVQPMEVAAMKDAGWESPEAALQTYIWARAAGNDKVLANQFAWVGSARAAADGAFAQLSDPVREKWGTPDRLAGSVLFSGQPGVSGYETIQTPGGMETVRGAPLRLVPPNGADPIVRVWAGIDPAANLARPGTGLQIIAWVQTASGAEQRAYFFLSYGANGRWTTGTPSFNAEDWNRIVAAIDPGTGEIVRREGGR